MMKDQAILQTLQEATTRAVSLSTTPALPVAYVGMTFTPPNDQKYLELVIIPNNRNDDFWGNEKNYRGMFRFILHWPNDNEGAYPPMNALASIVAYFSKDLILGDVKITSNPDSGGVLAQGSENLYPATVRYSSFSL